MQKRTVLRAAGAVVGFLSLPASSWAQFDFEPAAVFGTSFIATDVVLADLDRNGVPELVIAGETLSTAVVQVARGNGDGTFAAGVDYAIGYSAGIPAAADLNHDGKLDIVVAGRDGDVQILLGLGDGRLGAAASHPIGGQLNPVVVADFNGDGHSDIVTAWMSLPGFVVLYGAGDGTFGSPIHGAEAVDVIVHDIKAGDFNGDGHADLALATHSDSTSSVIVAIGDGAGGVSASHEYAGNAHRLAVGDVNIDGHPDLANVGERFLLGSGDGTFTPAGGDYLNSNSPALADFDGDGNLDLAGYRTLGVVSVWRGHGDGAFDEPEDFSTGSSDSAVAVYAGLITAGPSPDIVSVNSGSYYVGISVYVNRLAIDAIFRDGFD